jgi:hypothetical protein
VRSTVDRWPGVFKRKSIQPKKVENGFQGSVLFSHRRHKGLEVFLGALPGFFIHRWAQSFLEAGLAASRESTSLIATMQWLAILSLKRAVEHADFNKAL